MVTSLVDSCLFMAEVHVVNEHRTAPRRRLLKAGKIAFGGGAIDCTVRNLSETGAALEVASPVGIPERFTLMIEVNHIHVPCRVVWRKKTRIGVRFVS
jgi:PilZ domain